MMRWYGVVSIISACTLSLGLGILLGRGDHLRSPAAASLKGDLETEMAEIKLELSPADLRAVLGLLELQGPDSEPKRRTITPFDSRDLQLHREGIVLRSRVKPDGDGDTTIKIRDIQNGQLDPDLHSRKGFKCEKDRGTRPDSGSRNCSYSDDRSALEFAHVLVMKDRPLTSLFSSKQLRYFEDSALPRLGGREPWNSLQLMGPVSSSTWKAEAPFAPDLELTVELWEIPGVNRMLELSLRAPIHEADEAAGRLEEWARRNQLQPLHSQASKTEWVLRHFAGQLRR